MVEGIEEEEEECVLAWSGMKLVLLASGMVPESL